MVVDSTMVGIILDSTYNRDTDRVKKKLEVAHAEISFKRVHEHVTH